MIFLIVCLRIGHAHLRCSDRSFRALCTKQLKKHRAGRCFFNRGAPRRIRTLNLLIRSQMLYPIEPWAQYALFYNKIFQLQEKTTKKYLLMFLILFFQKLTIQRKSFILLCMKRIFILIFMVVLCAIVLGGCGVKSALEHDPDYPRNYPVY